MKLSFYAKEDALVRYPGLSPAIGQAARYIGREFVPGETALGADGKRHTVKSSGNPATREAAEFDSESEAGKGAMRHCRKGALWPADKETAAACGVPLVAVEFVDGAYVAKPEKRSNASATVKESA